jgi:hypothetical protein
MMVSQAGMKKEIIAVFSSCHGAVVCPSGHFIASNLYSRVKTSFKSSKLFYLFGTFRRLAQPDQL